jgi:hypothetical protein
MRRFTAISVEIGFWSVLTFAVKEGTARAAAEDTRSVVRARSLPRRCGAGRWRTSGLMSAEMREAKFETIHSVEREETWS